MKRVVIICISIVIVFININVSFSESISKLIKTANDYYKNGNYYLALQEYQKILSDNLNVEVASYIHLRMGLCYYKLGDFSKSADEFDKVITEIRARKYLEDALFLSAKAYFNLDNYSTSAVRLLKLISIGPNGKYYNKAKEGYRNLVETALNYEQIEWTVSVIKTEYNIGKYLFELSKEEVSKKNYDKAYIILYLLEDKYSYLEIIEDVRSLLDKVRKLRKPEKNKIGCLINMSGEYASYGNEVLNGVKMALDNFGGGEFELFVEDSKGTFEDALSGYRKLTDINKTACVIGPLFTSELIGLSKYADLMQVPLISPAAGSGDMKDAGEFVFRCAVSNRLQAKVLATYAVKSLNLQRIAILYPNSSYGIELDKYFKEYAQKLGAKIVIEQPYEPIEAGGEMTKSYITEVKKVKSSRPDAIFIPGHYEELMLIVPQIGFANIPAILLGANGWAEERVARVGAKCVEGSYFTSPFFEGDDDPLVQNFIKEYYRIYKQMPTYLSAQSYDATMIALKLLSKGDVGLDFVNALKNFDYNGVTGRISLRGDGNDCDKTVYILTIREGTILPAQGQ
ncbi:MAG: ABC transporter substrate-binding protein [bacterium]